MVFQLDHENTLVNLNCKYFFASQHRNHANEDKSQWHISMPEEMDSFIESKGEGWAVDCLGWGIRADLNKNLLILGHNPHQEPLKFAKFIDSGQNSIWHGYPADYMRKSQDRPSVQVLRLWLEKGIICKHHMTKIRGGKTCNL